MFNEEALKKATFKVVTGEVKGLDKFKGHYVIAELDGKEETRGLFCSKREADFHLANLGSGFDLPNSTERMNPVDADSLDDLR